MNADKQNAIPSVSIRVHLRFVFSFADCGFNRKEPSAEKTQPKRELPQKNTKKKKT
jgi:hypothetical protein